MEEKRVVFGLNIVRFLDIECYSLAQISLLAEKADSLCAQGKLCVCVIDEFEMMEPEHFKMLGSFCQIVACGDYRQRITTSCDQPIYDFIKRAGGVSFEADVVWRSKGSGYFNLLSLLVYNGKYSSLTSASYRSENEEDLFRLRTISSSANLASAAICIYARSMFLLDREPCSILIICDREETRRALALCIANAPDHLEASIKQSIKSCYSNEARGMEAGFVLFSTLDLDKQNAPVADYLEIISIVLGRAKLGIEAVLPFASPSDDIPKRGPFTDLILPLCHAYVDTKPTSQVTYAEAALELSRTGLCLIDLEGIPIIYRAGGPSIALDGHCFFFPQSWNESGEGRRRERNYRNLLVKGFYLVQARFDQDIVLKGYQHVLEQFLCLSVDTLPVFYEAVVEDIGLKKIVRGKRNQWLSKRL